MFSSRVDCAFVGGFFRFVVLPVVDFFLLVPVVLFALRVFGAVFVGIMKVARYVSGS